MIYRVPIPASPESSWLQLLHAGLPRHVLEERRDVEARSGSAPNASRDSELALQIHDRLTDLARQSRELAALNTVARRLASVQGMDSVLTEVVAQSRQLLGGDLAYVMLREPEGGQLRIEVVDGSLGSTLTGIRLSPGEGLGGEVLRTGQPLWVESYLDAAELRHLARVDDAALSEHLGGMLGLPLRVGGDVLGVLIVADRRPRQFTPAEVELLAGLAAHAAVAVSNARLFKNLERTLDRLRSTNAQLEDSLERRSRESALSEALGEAVVAGADTSQLCQILSEAAGFPVHLIRGSNARADDAGAGPACAPVMLSDGCAGWLTLCTDGPSLPEHLQLLVIGAASVAVVLAHERTVAQVELRTRGELLHVLFDTDSDVDTVRRRAAGAGIDLDAVSAVMVVRGPERALRAARNRGLLNLTSQTGSWLGDHGDEIVLLALGPSATTIAERVRLHVPDLGQATVGIAACQGGVEPIRQAYVSARQTSLVLQALEREGGIALGGELGAFQALLSHAGRGDLRAFIDATIGELVRGDEKRGRDLTRTLARYLANAQHHARTCADLHIHANTLYARLERITEMLGPTWRDPDRLLEIQLALRMRNLVTRIETGPDPVSPPRSTP